MSNGKLLQELKEITEEDDKTIPTRQMNRLMLTAMLELHEKVEELMRTQTQCAEVITKTIGPLKKNPLVILGDHIARHPKITVLVFIGLLMMSNLWFIDEIRYSVLVWLRVPEEIIKLLVHGG